ncbi:MAG: tRNA lysidine(34) synthetase TilS [Acetobacter sp.]|nr:tRNA lysidine(34) synthetase TilS [Bacteroides sp.]MCM1341423.1 tRNA lysidine(34) synthetase TilS [Acetobacter sp.]MCM1433377.1 tRNA lysidine(34) synthetase TilS [Clostridiales bacterium]
MINRFLNTLSKHNMISSGDRILLAVSGGADSVVMLHLFKAVKKQLNLKLIAAHVEHGIRGDESLFDAQFVKKLCDDNGIEFHQLSIDAVGGAKECGESVEEYSRRRRYEFFDTIPCDKIATAHNADDNAETLIFRLCRGTGLKGAVSIPPVRDKIIRPLIELSSAEIREYADNNGIKYRVDSTNNNDDYTRNYIRHHIIPALDNINNSAVKRINDFISDAVDDNEFIESVASSAFEDCVLDNQLLIDKLKKYHISIAKRVIFKFFYTYGVRVDRNHLAEIIKLLDKTGKVQIKGNYFAVSNNGRLYFYDQTAVKNKKEIISNVLNVFEFDNNSVDFYCDYDKINGKVTFRHRKNGDKIAPVGRNCTKTLKKLFNELRIPEMERKDVVIACDESGIIGVIPYCVDERVKADSNTKTIFSVKIPTEDC